MKKTILIFFTFLLISPLAYGSSGPFGLGIMLGGPTGISANYNMSRDNSIDGGLGFDLGDGDFHLHGTYLWHFRRSISIENYYFGWYLGAGARMISKDNDNNGNNDDDDFLLGPRGSAGLNFPLKRGMFDAFAEVALIMNIIEKTDLDADFAIGARYYF